MSKTVTEESTDEQIAKDVSRHPNVREAARARLIAAASSDSDEGSSPKKSIRPKE